MRAKNRKKSKQLGKFEQFLIEPLEYLNTSKKCWAKNCNSGL